MTKEDVRALVAALVPLIKAELASAEQRLAARDTAAETRLAALEERFAKHEQRLATIETKAATAPQYKGIWQRGTPYQPNELVTVDGSLWISLVPDNQTRPGEGPGSWQLCAKRGRDGRDATSPH
jgi:hypothetical protein